MKINEAIVAGFDFRPLGFSNERVQSSPRLMNDDDEKHQQ